MWDDSEDSKAVKGNELDQEEMHFHHHSRKDAGKITGRQPFQGLGTKREECLGYLTSVWVTEVRPSPKGQVGERGGRLRIKNQEVLLTEN